MANAFSKDEFRENKEIFSVSSFDPLQSSQDQNPQTVCMTIVRKKKLEGFSYTYIQMITSE